MPDAHGSTKTTQPANFKSMVNAVFSTLEIQRLEIERLRTALREMIYETTHLSPENDDGSHDCRIRATTLRQAREALNVKGA